MVLLEVAVILHMPPEIIFIPVPEVPEEPEEPEPEPELELEAVTEEVVVPGVAVPVKNVIVIMMVIVPVAMVPAVLRVVVCLPVWVPCMCSALLPYGRRAEPVGTAEAVVPIMIHGKRLKETAEHSIMTGMDMVSVEPVAEAAAAEAAAVPCIKTMVAVPGVIFRVAAEAAEAVTGTVPLVLEAKVPMVEAAEAAVL